MTDDINSKLQKLRDKIEVYSYEYYTLDAPTVPDSHWDRLFRELQDIEEANPQLITAESPTQHVGAHSYDYLKSKGLL